MKQPRIPLPPTTEADMRAGIQALLKRMTVEGRQRTHDFWEVRKQPKSTASAK